MISFARSTVLFLSAFPLKIGWRRGSGYEPPAWQRRVREPEGRPTSDFEPRRNGVEARVGIEPTIEDLQSSALPLGDRAEYPTQT